MERNHGAAEDNAEFIRQEREHRYRWAKPGLALGVVLMPLGSLLDWSVYRDQFWPLLMSRWVVVALLATGLVTRKYWCRGRLFEPISFLLILAPGLFISGMIYLTEGASSRYYFGLILLMIIVQFLGFRATEAAAFCVSLVASYMTAVVLADGLNSVVLDEAVEGIFFLFVSAVACVTGCFLYRRNRFEAYCLNRDLAIEEELRRKSIVRLQDTEQQLVHSEKMRAIAGVAAGLLHEINNPVNFSLMAIKVLKKRVKTDEDAMETVTDIEAGVNRISQIVTDLRSFAHPEQVANQAPFRLREAVDTAIRFLTHELPEGRVVLKDKEELGREVVGAQSHIVQVILNLLLNAEKAIRPRQDATTCRITIESQVRDQRAFISVKDMGIGMDASQLKLVREPFFTTRSGEGLGLGLGICEAIIRTHGGSLEIQSEPGAGTTVTFDLALHAPAVDTAVAGGSIGSNKTPITQTLPH
ncbi:MAG: HAMP domain-containing sensor histidine kinase [Planctomycetota bacterium]